MTMSFGTTRPTLPAMPSVARCLGRLRSVPVPRTKPVLGKGSSARGAFALANVATTRAQTGLEIVANVSIIATAVLLGWTLLKPKPGPSTPELEGKTISYQGAALRGSSSAPAGLIVYSDFECPFCARFERETLTKLFKLYVDSGKVLVAFRHLPLPIHENAVMAANAAWCAGGQGRFWDMHDALFRSQNNLRAETVRDLAQELGLGTPWTNCVEDLMDQTETAIDRDANGARALGIGSTPTILVGPTQSDGSIKVSAVFAAPSPSQNLLAPLTRF